MASSHAFYEKGILRVQWIVGSLLYYAREVNNNLLVDLSTIRAQQASATVKTRKAINQILYYCATYPDDGTLYRSSDMIMTAKFDAGFNNKKNQEAEQGPISSSLKTNPSPVGIGLF